jgi:hypothetical protein
MEAVVDILALRRPSQKTFLRAVISEGISITPPSSNQQYSHNCF